MKKSIGWFIAAGVCLICLIPKLANIKEADMSLVVAYPLLAVTFAALGIRSIMKNK